MLPHTVSRALAITAISALMFGCRHNAHKLLAPAGTCRPSAIVASAAATAPLPALNAAATFDSVWTIIARSHWDTTYNGVNWQAVHDSLRPRAVNAASVGELRAVLTAMISTLGQSHFVILPGDIGGLRNSGNAIEGMGTIGATVRYVDGVLLISTARAGGAALAAGLRPGYVIEAVNGCALAKHFAQMESGMEPRRAKFEAWRIATALLSGRVGESVPVRARNRSGNIHEYIVQLEAPLGDVLKFGNIAPRPAHLEFTRRVVGRKSVGVISFNTWLPALSGPFADAMDSLRSADAIVVDVRGNLGGIGSMSATFAGHFVDSALTLGTMFMRGSTTKYVAVPQRLSQKNQRVKPYTGALAVVIDELSASTSELFAAGLKAGGRARLFGVQTAGRALPSVIERLPNGDRLQHAVANYLLPGGFPIEGVGVIPDVTAPITRAALLRGADPALDRAVLWGASVVLPSVKAARTVPPRD